MQLTRLYSMVAYRPGHVWSPRVFRVVHRPNNGPNSFCAA